jgi:hypothetical protein
MEEAAFVDPDYVVGISRDFAGWFWNSLTKLAISPVLFYNRPFLKNGCALRVNYVNPRPQFVLL